LLAGIDCPVAARRKGFQLTGAIASVSGYVVPVITLLSEEQLLGAVTTVFTLAGGVAAVLIALVSVIALFTQ
jgi:type IV secretory pathway TrbD component